MAATIKVDTIQNSSSAVANLSLDTSGNVTGGGTIADSVGVIRPRVFGTSQATTSGSSITVSGIPSWATRITILLSSISLSGTDDLCLQIGTSSGLETSSYAGNGIAIVSGQAITGSSPTAHFSIIAAYTAATYLYTGRIVLTLYGSNTWVLSGWAGNEATRVSTMSYGKKALSGTLDRVCIKTETTNTFDNGSFIVLYE